MMRGFSLLNHGQCFALMLHGLRISVGVTWSLLDEGDTSDTKMEFTYGCGSFPVPCFFSHPKNGAGIQHV